MDRHNALIACGEERPYSSGIEFIGETGLIAVSGVLDFYAAPRFAQDVDQTVAFARGDLILDLSDLDLIDSSALCVAGTALQRLVITRSHVMRIFTITGLQNAFPIVASRREALQRVVARAADHAIACPPRDQALLRGAA
jgi:anti-anti-sigma factor